MSEHAGRRTWWWMVPLAVVAAFFVWAGYGEGWAWTGLSRQVTLWDWLEGLALPFTVGLVPLLLPYRGHLSTRHLTTGLLVLTAFAALVSRAVGLDRLHRQHAVGLAEPGPAADRDRDLDLLASHRPAESARSDTRNTLSRRKEASKSRRVVMCRLGVQRSRA